MLAGTNGALGTASSHSHTYSTTLPEAGVVTIVQRSLLGKHVVCHQALMRTNVVASSYRCDVLPRSSVSGMASVSVPNFSLYVRGGLRRVAIAS